MYLLEEWKKEFQGKKILIWGYAREGQSSYRLIRNLCPSQKIFICDGNDDTKYKLEKETENTEYISQNNLPFESFDLILKSPGIVVQDKKIESCITSQTELFLKYYSNMTVGITGTKGKSTTTSLLHAVLQKKYHSHLVGNIGIPCFDAIEMIHEGDVVCFELSCHQMEYTKYSPHVAVFLNLYEEHLDHYQTLEHYASAKANILRYQRKTDVAVIHQNLKFNFPLPENLWYIGKDISAKDRTITALGKELKIESCFLIGEHNYQNIAVVYAIAHRLFGISDEQFIEAVASFTPLAHRLQDLGEFEMIRFVDDSISTIGQSCIQAIESINDVDTVLIGGMDRGIDYSDLEEYLGNHNHLHAILMYATGKRIYEEMKRSDKIHDCIHLCADLQTAVELARHLTKPHHICLLSPAASSYDHFKNFEERGDVFRKLAFKQ